MDQNVVAVPDGMQPLPYALASPGALKALEWLAQAVKKGMVLLGAQPLYESCHLDSYRELNTFMRNDVPLQSVYLEDLERMQASV